MSAAQASNPEYLFPSSVQEVIDLLEAGGGSSCIIAGGTDILPDIRRGKINPGCLVDITRIPELDQIKLTKEYVLVGAAVTFADIKDSQFINQYFHALAEAAASVGALAIQNAATWVGNIIQAMPAADGAIIALALDAEVYLVDKTQAAWLPVESLFVGPGVSRVNPSRQLITHIRFPRGSERRGTAWQRVGRRPSLVLPIINCAATIQLDPDCQIIERATIALGPTGLRPHRAGAAEKFLKGQAASKASFKKAAQLVQRDSDPRHSITRASREYRLAIIAPMVETALSTAAYRAKNISSTWSAAQPVDFHWENNILSDQPEEL